MILGCIILLGVLVYFIFFVTQFFNIIIYGYPPFISSSPENINKIIAATEIKEQDTIYELGCGRARFLRTIEKNYSKTKLVGVENLFSLYFINKLRLKFQGSKIKLLNKNLFNLNLGEADIIYCYLNNTTMIKLGEKIVKECRGGTQIISHAFSVPQLIPTKLIKLNNKKIYFYVV